VKERVYEMDKQRDGAE